MSDQSGAIDTGEISSVYSRSAWRGNGAGVRAPAPKSGQAAEPPADAPEVAEPSEEAVDTPEEARQEPSSSPEPEKPVPTEPPAPAPAAPPAETAKELEEARALLKLAKDNPAEFLKLHGSADPVQARLAAIAKEAAEARRAKDDLKAEKARVDRASQLEADLASDPFAVIERVVGPDAYNKWTQRILGKAPPAGEKKAQGSTELDALRKELEEVKAAKQLTPEDVANEIRAAQWWGAYDAEHGKPEYAVLGAYEGDELKREVGTFVSGYHERTGILLTPAQALTQLHQAEVDRLRKLIIAEPARKMVEQMLAESSQGGKSSPPQKRPTSSPEANPGAKTLTTELQGTVTRTEQEDWDLLPDKERMRRLQAKYTKR